VAGLFLTLLGDPLFGFLVEVTSIASFLYHYGQLHSNGVDNLPIVRLSLLFDYACALFSIGVGLVYLSTSGDAQVMNDNFATDRAGACHAWVLLGVGEGTSLHDLSRFVAFLFGLHGLRHWVNPLGRLGSTLRDEWETGVGGQVNRAAILPIMP
jgi:hypothetical protein